MVVCLGVVGWRNGAWSCLSKGRLVGWAHPVDVPVAQWFDAVEAAVRAQLAEVDVSRPDDDMLTFARGTRGLVLQGIADVVIVAPSFAAGGTIGSRLHDRVQHLEMTSFSVTQATVQPVTDLVVGQLKG